MRGFRGETRWGRVPGAGLKTCASDGFNGSNDSNGSDGSDGSEGSDWAEEGGFSGVGAVSGFRGSIFPDLASGSFGLRPTSEEGDVLPNDGREISSFLGNGLTVLPPAGTGFPVNSAPDSGLPQHGQNLITASHSGHWMPSPDKRAADAPLWVALGPQ